MNNNLDKQIQKLQVGQYFPMVQLGTTIFHTCELLENSNKNVVVLISTSCEPCIEALEVIYEWLHLSNQNKIHVLVDSSNEDFHKLKEIFPSRTKLYQISIFEMISFLHSSAIPWIYVLDDSGRILASAPFNTIERFNEIIHPAQGA